MSKTIQTNKENMQKGCHRIIYPLIIIIIYLFYTVLYEAIAIFYLHKLHYVTF